MITAKDARKNTNKKVFSESHNLTLIFKEIEEEAFKGKSQITTGLNITKEEKDLLLDVGYILHFDNSNHSIDILW